MIHPRPYRAIVVLPTFLLLAGCRMGVPIHVWEPPKLESAVGKTVAIANVRGPKELSEPVRQKMLQLAPSDAGRAITAVDPDQLSQSETIRLVSASDEEPSDLALASVARRDGIDYILRGEVLTKRYSDSKTLDPDEPLKLSWRLMSVADDRHAGGSPVVVDAESAAKRYPDVALLPNSTELLTTAAVRDTYRLISPSIERHWVQLSVPYGLPGSKEVRRGNTLAVAGKWGEAEKIWTKVAEGHPTQIAAVHNLALAAAAGQDFSRAKGLARKAIRRQPTRLHQQTLVWIELHQRAYHRAFGLPDPPEGWYLTQ